MPKIHANQDWNPTGVIAQRGQTYRFAVAPHARWWDVIIPSGPGGYRFNPLDPLGRKLRIKELDGAKLPYFCLIGTIGQDEATAFLIGRGRTITAAQDGEFFAFANDAPGFYGNNFGSLQLTITKV